MTTQDYGPFGRYPEPCVGRLLNQLVRKHDIPLMTVERLSVGLGTITLRGEKVGTYQWVDNTAQVSWTGEMRRYNKPACA